MGGGGGGGGGVDIGLLHPGTQFTGHVGWKGEAIFRNGDSPDSSWSSAATLPLNSSFRLPTQSQILNWDFKIYEYKFYLVMIIEDPVTNIVTWWGVQSNPVILRAVNWCKSVSHARILDPKF